MVKIWLEVCDEVNMDGDDGWTKFSVLSKYKLEEKKTIAYINTMYIATTN